MKNSVTRAIRMQLLQIRYDVIQGYKYNIKKLPIIILPFVVVCFFCKTDIAAFKKLGYIKSDPGAAEYILYFSEGMREYIPNSNIPFQVPFAWLSVNLLLAFLVGDYVTKDLNEIGTQMLLRSSQRHIWFLGKVAYGISATIIIYLIETSVCIIFGIISGNAQWQFADDIWTMFFGVNPALFAKPEIISGLILLPLYTSLVISVIQIILMIHTGPLYSFIIVAIYVVASSYWKSYLLIGNYSMFLRNERICDNGLSQLYCYIVLSGLFLTVTFVGTTSFKRFDIIDKK